MAAHRYLASGLIAVLLLFSATNADAQEYVRLRSYFDGDKPLFCFEVALKRVQKVPDWNQKGEPPISRTKAVELGAQQLRSTYPAVDRFELHRVDLDRVNVQYEVFHGDVWYYLIEYAAVIGRERKHSATDYVAIVLFDGRPVAKKTGKCSPIASTFAPNNAMYSDNYSGALRAPVIARNRER